MERRKASPEQLNMLLRFMEEDNELAKGKFSGLEGRNHQTNAWKKITEKLNARSSFGSGAVKTPDKWQQTWRDWKSNVKKKAFKIHKNQFTPSCTTMTELTEAEKKILRLISSNTSLCGLHGVPETTVNDKTQMVLSQSHGTNNNVCNSDPSVSGIKWVTESHSFTSRDIELGLGAGVGLEPDAVMVTNNLCTETAKPLCKKGHSHIKLSHDKLLSLDEERIQVEKQKFLEKKRCNNIRLKLEKDRLEIERQRNVLLEKLVVAVEMVVHR